MEIWKNYIVAGNQRFADGDFQSAHALYEAARREADKLFPVWREPDEAVSALVVTYHNIADLHQEQGMTKDARSALEKAHSIVLKAVVSTPIEHKRHPALRRGSNKTYSALQNHKRDHALLLTH